MSKYPHRRGMSPGSMRRLVSSKTSIWEHLLQRIQEQKHNSKREERQNVFVLVFKYQYRTPAFRIFLTEILDFN